MDRKAYLESILSQGKSKYKRVTMSPIRYPGGKSLAVGYLVESMPDDVDKLVSPFFGGGSFEIVVNKVFGIPVQGYDIFRILANYWKYQIERPGDLSNALGKLEPTKEEYKAVKDKLKSHWEAEHHNRDGELLDDFDLAVYYYFNFNLSYGPGFLGWPSSVYLDTKRYRKMLEKVKQFQVDGISVGCEDFHNIIDDCNEEFIYCDPPYHIGEESKTFAGIYPMRNIPIHHKGFDHGGLAELLKAYKGKFMLSYNDCPYIREMYKEFNQQFPSWQYTMGQGETRIGKNRQDQDTDHVKESHEILITNY